MNSASSTTAMIPTARRVRLRPMIFAPVTARGTVARFLVRGAEWGGGPGVGGLWSE